jgi:hypothetical protein
LRQLRTESSGEVKSLINWRGFYGFQQEKRAAMEVKIIEANGWAKVLPVNRAITLVGSAASNDVQLPSAQISPYQLQILYAPDLPSSCRVVNLGSDVVLQRNSVENTVSAFQSLDIFNGDELLLDDYRIIFHLPLTTASVQKSRSLEASLVLPETVLRPDSTLAGILRVKNAGNLQGVQFQVSLEGLPPDCYQIDPIPLMYPGAEEEVQVRLFHRTLSPSAGLHELLLTVNAPGDYMGETLEIRQGLYVTPVLKHELIILDSYAEAARGPDSMVTQKVPLPPSFAVPGSFGSFSPAITDFPPDSSSSQVHPADAYSSTAAVGALPAVPQTAATPTSKRSLPPVEPGPPKVKVVRTQGTDDWDE